ncbi:MAG: group 1 truncated hemoglobin [Pseudomonas sp.]|uniref:group I truncated hemoglobin n=1 Tax=Pseudomonas sp. TaxID=306 RepID=UPI00273624B8|nr:group 1 truncated hemoglobin [Pseudomonas sp.]MDP3846984.1 group 1 truncated hemoglobin [Pseudomonas sp.]
MRSLFTQLAATQQQFCTLILTALLSLISVQAHAEQTTFEKFGSKPGLVLIVDDMMLNLIAAPLTKPFFDNPKKDFIKFMLVEQFCDLLDGGCKYSGRDMKTTHANFKIGRAEFNSLVESLQIAMDKHAVPFTAQNQLLAKLAPMYRDVEAGNGPAPASGTNAK